MRIPRCTLQATTLHSGFIIFFLILSAGVAHAQSGVAVRALFYDTHLTGREHEGRYVGLSASMDLTSKLYLVGKGGYLRSVNRNWFNGSLPDGLNKWRDRHHVMLDAGVGVHLVHFSTGALQHHFGPSFSISYRYRREEIIDAAYQPAYFIGLPQDLREDMLRGCEATPHKYCFTYEDGEGGGIDGQYVVFTGPTRTSDIGLVGGFNYRLLFRHFEIGAEAGLYRYLHQERKWGGTHTYFWGITVGYLF